MKITRVEFHNGTKYDKKTATKLIEELREAAPYAESACVSNLLSDAATFISIMVDVFLEEES